MQTQPVRDRRAPTARADPSLPHAPWLTLTRTHTRANAHARSRAPPHTEPAPGSARCPHPAAPSRSPARQPLAHPSLHPLPPACTHAHARSPRAPAPGGGASPEGLRGGGNGGGGAGPGAASGVPGPSRARLPRAASPREGSGLPLAFGTLTVGAENTLLLLLLPRDPPSLHAISRSPQQAGRVNPQTGPEAAPNSSAGAGWRLDFGETLDWGPSPAPPPGSGLIFMF